LTYQAIALTMIIKFAPNNAMAQAVLSLKVLEYAVVRNLSKLTRFAMLTAERTRLRQL
jgi:hypothetical protein